MKKENGITLIALVVTIIVLLILAGITINLTIGQDGILKRAQEAGKNYTNAASYENEQLEELTNVTDKIIQNLIGTIEQPKETIIAINLSGENEQSTVPISLSMEVTEDGEKLTSYKWVLNNESEEIGTQKELYTQEIENKEKVNLEINELGIYYLHVLTVDEAGKSKETIKGPIEIVAAKYHAHTGNSTSGGGCYTTALTEDVYSTCTHNRSWEESATENGDGRWYCVGHYGAGSICGQSVTATTWGSGEASGNHSNPTYTHNVVSGTKVTGYSLGCKKTTSTVENYIISY